MIRAPATSPQTGPPTAPAPGGIFGHRSRPAAHGGGRPGRSARAGRACAVPLSIRSARSPPLAAMPRRRRRGRGPPDGAAGSAARGSDVGAATRQRAPPHAMIIRRRSRRGSPAAVGPPVTDSAGYRRPEADSRPPGLDRASDRARPARSPQSPSARTGAAAREPPGCGRATDRGTPGADPPSAGLRRRAGRAPSSGARVCSQPTGARGSVRAPAHHLCLYSTRYCARHSAAASWLLVAMSGFASTTRQFLP
jgi:hypothetical protein